MRRDRRRGYVIVELLLVISALAVLFGICVVLLHGLLKLDRGGRAHLAEATTRDRLARRFRLDVRAASDSKPGRAEDGAADRLELSLPDGRVINYRVVKGRIVRDEHDKNGGTIHHESFRLPSHAIPEFQTRQVDKSLFINLQLRPGPASAQTRSPRDPGCEALLGKDLRFVNPRGTAR